MMAMMITLPTTTGAANSKMSEEKKESVPGYTQTKVGDYNLITPDDKKASVYQKVTPREQYKVARDVANRAINEINAIRSRRPSSFTGGINDANIAARMQAAETYGDTLPGGRGYSRSRRAAYDIADSYRNVLATAPKPVKRNPPVFKPDRPDPQPPKESHDAWINQQYKELLGRDAGTEGLNYWTGDLNRGQTKDQVRSNIMLSDEYKNRLKLVTDYKNEHGVNPAEDWLDARVGPGGKWLMEGYGNKSATTSTGSLSNDQISESEARDLSSGLNTFLNQVDKTPEAAPNMALTESPDWDKSIGYAPKSFGVGPEYDKYTKIFQNQIDEGSTLESAMYLSRTSTPEDFLKAFGDRSMWRKWKGSSKGGIRGKGHKSRKSSTKSNSVASGRTNFRAPSFSSFGSNLMCDIRVKTDIAPLMSTEINDDLAELAFFVKELRVK